MEQKYIINKSGDKALPITSESAVRDANGNPLSSKLGVINDALDARYTKSETYSKSQLDNLITTPNQKYVTVEADDQTTDVTDVLPATGEKDTIYRVGNWDGSAYDVTTYSEYAWDGTAYKFLSKKSQIGEVYDISAANGNDTYTDLNDALTNGGVPSSIRKGGMSVKFVQSSDNKYVRCNYLLEDATTNSKFTNVANWQGVDDEPTAESDNLVKSGGVVSFMKYINTTKESQWVRENLSASGVPSSSTTRCAKSFSCVLGDKIMVNINSGYKAGLFFYDKILDVDKVNSDSFLSYVAFKASSFYTAIPKECQTVVIIVGKSNNGDITENEAALFGSVNILSTEDIADRSYFRIYDDIQINEFDVTMTNSGRLYTGLLETKSVGAVRYGIKGGTYTLSSTDDVLVLNLSENDPSSTYDNKPRLVPTVRNVHKVLPTDFPIVCRLGDNLFRHQPVLDSFIINSINNSATILRGEMSSAITKLKGQITSTDITDISKLTFVNGSVNSSFRFVDGTTNRLITLINGANIKKVTIKTNSGFQAGLDVVKGIYTLDELVNNVRIGYSWSDSISAHVPSSYNTIVITIRKVGNADIAPSEVTSAVNEIEIITDRVYIDKEDISSGTYTGNISDFCGNIISSNFCRLEKVPDNKRQGGAVYGENLFLFHTSTNSCLIYNINTGLQIGEVVLPVTSHCNTMLFAPTLHDGNTEYPYLYVSEVIGSAASTEEPSWWRIFVFDIKTVSETLTATLVQTINTQTLSTSYRGLGPVDFAIDTDNNYMWLVCCKTKSIYTGNTIFTKIAIPSISNATVNVQDADVLDTFEVNDIPIRQDCKYYNGKVYVLWGFHGSGYSNGLAVVDLVNKEISAQCNLKTIADDEPEALVIYNGNLLYVCKDEYIRKLIFLT